MIDDRQLITTLLAGDLISQSVLQQGLELAQRDDATLYDVLIAYDLLDERDIIATASEILNVPSVCLADLDIEPDTAHLLSADLATSNQSVPVEVIDEDGVETLKLAMVDPIDVMAMDEIASHIGIDIQPVLAGPSDVESAIAELYSSQDETNDADLNEADGDGDPHRGLMDFDDFAMTIEDSEDDVSDEDDEPLDLSGDEDIQLSGEFIIDDGEVAELDDDDVIELSDELLLDNDDVLDSDEEFEAEPALVDEPSGLEEDEDSWAAMFGDESDAESLDEDQVDEDAVDEQSSQGDAGTSSPPDSEDTANQTFIGTPANMELDEIVPDDESTDGEDSIEEFEIEELDAADDDGTEEVAQDAKPTRAMRDPDAHSSTPVGLGTRSNDGSSEDTKDGATKTSPKNGEKKKKSVVPKSIRDALKSATSRKKKKKKKEPKKPSPEKAPPSKSAAETQESQPLPEAKTREADSGSALARIEVKKVAVPAFKGAVEKRSDKGKEEKKEDTPKRPRQKTPKKNESPRAPETREISLSEMANLVGNKDNDDDAIEFPEGIDSEQLLRALIRLLLAKEVLSSDEVESLLQELV